MAYDVSCRECRAIAAQIRDVVPAGWCPEHGAVTGRGPFQPLVAAAEAVVAWHRGEAGALVYPVDRRLLEELAAALEVARGA